MLALLAISIELTTFVMCKKLHMWCFMLHREGNKTTSKNKVLLKLCVSVIEYGLSECLIFQMIS